MTKVAALQIGSLKTTAETLEQILAYRNEVIDSGAKLVVIPEATLGGYPKSLDFGTVLGSRTPEGIEEFRQYFENAVRVPGPETDQLAKFSASTDASIVIGVIERDGSTLYCTALLFTPKDGLAAKHRKLMPTASERLIWGQGDGSTLPTVETAAGRVGTAICWENFMPLLRTAMYAKGVEVWCAPTVDDREMWRVSMRHIAYEGRMFVISAVQFQDSPKNLGITRKNWDDPERPLINGGSVIVDPMGNIVAGPLIGKPGLITADINLDDIPRARYDFDPVGHYSRPDVFKLQVNEKPQSVVDFD